MTLSLAIAGYMDSSLFVVAMPVKQRVSRVFKSISELLVQFLQLLGLSVLAIITDNSWLLNVEVLQNLACARCETHMREH